MKKAIILLLSILLAVSFCACSNSVEVEEKETDVSTTHQAISDDVIDEYVDGEVTNQENETGSNSATKPTKKSKDKVTTSATDEKSPVIKEENQTTRPGNTATEPTEKEEKEQSSGGSSSGNKVDGEVDNQRVNIIDLI